MYIDPCCKFYFNLKKKKSKTLVVFTKNRPHDDFRKPPSPVQTANPTTPLTPILSLLSLPPPPLSLLAAPAPLPPLPSCSPPASTTTASSLPSPRPARPPASASSARGPSPAAGPPALDLAGACSERRPATPRRGGPGRARPRHRRPRQARPVRSRAPAGVAAVVAQRVAAGAACARREQRWLELQSCTQSLCSPSCRHEHCRRSSLGSHRELVKPRKHGDHVQPRGIRWLVESTPA